MALTDEQRLLRSVSEAAWQAQVEQTLALAGFQDQYHVNDSRKDRRGWPDLIAIRHTAHSSTLVIAELKTETGRVRPEQARWLGAWRTLAAIVNQYCRPAHVNVIVDVWRPSDAERLWDLLQEKEG